MFSVTKEVKYKFILDGITYSVIEDEPDSKDLRVQTVHGEFDFSKNELQELLENGEADFPKRR